MRNRVFLGAIFEECCRNFLIAGCWTFLPKFLEVAFEATPTTANFALGKLFLFCPYFFFFKKVLFRFGHRRLCAGWIVFRHAVAIPVSPGRARKFACVHGGCSCHLDLFDGVPAQLSGRAHRRRDGVLPWATADLDIPEYDQREEGAWTVHPVQLRLRLPKRRVRPGVLQASRTRSQVAVDNVLLQVLRWLP